MVHVPVATNVTVFPETVHTGVVKDAKVTVKPELALALTVNGGVASGWFDRAPNVIVWAALVTWKLRFTGVAAE